MRPLRQGAGLAVLTAMVVSVQALVGNIATSQVPHALRFLTPPPRAWILTGALILISAVLAIIDVRSSDRPRHVSTVEQVDAAADLLAVRMLKEWSRQVVARGIQTPAPVWVRWEWAGDDLAAERREVNTSTRLSTDPLPLPGAALGEVLSSGLVTRLHERVYAKLQHGRLVLVGGPGAGKTGAMIWLLLEALQHRARVPEGKRVEVPVPVWLTLGSWNPGRQGLHDWVIAAMARDHPYLRAADFGPDAIAQLLDRQRIALFLDGLDEMPAPLRAQALRRLAAEAARLRVVLTSRPDQYRAALQDSQGLPYAAVVELQPVGPQAAAAYLLEGRNGPARQAWQEITDQLQADPGGVLAQVLTTPLTLSLARGAGTDPSWMVSPQVGTPADLRDLLWDQALVNAYPESAERLHAVQWLAWIAHRMNTHPAGSTRDLAWWHIRTWTPRWQLPLFSGLVGALEGGLVFGLVHGLVFGLAHGLVGGLGSELLGGLEFGLAVGLGIGLARGLASRKDPEETVFRRPTPGELRTLLRVGLSRVLVLVFVSMFLSALAAKLVEMLVNWLGEEELAGFHAARLLIGLGFGLGGGLGGGLVDFWTRPVAVSAGATPQATHRADIRSQVVRSFVGGLEFGLAVGLLFGFVGGLAQGLALGLELGLTVGLVFRLVGGTTGRLRMLEALFLLRDQRVRFLPMLEVALQRQVLRQAGSVYQFRHANLQDRLASLYQVARPPGPARAPITIDVRSPAAMDSH